MNNLLKKRGQLKKVQILCRNILGGGVILINLFEQIKKNMLKSRPLYFNHGASGEVRVIEYI